MEKTSNEHNEWVSRFAARIRELSPTIADAETLEVAKVAFANANDLEPEEAAAVYGEILNAAVPVHELKSWIGTRARSRST